MPANIKSAIKASVQEAFTPASLKGTLFQELRGKLAVQDIGKVLAWLESPLGRKYTRLEEASSTPEALAEKQEYAARMQGSPPSAQRLKLSRELDSAIEGTENGVEMVVNIKVAIAYGIISTLPVEQQRPIEDISRELEKIKPGIIATVQSQTLGERLVYLRDPNG